MGSRDRHDRNKSDWVWAWEWAWDGMEQRAASKSTLLNKMGRREKK